MHPSRLRWCAVVPDLSPDHALPDVGAWAGDADPDTLIRLALSALADDDTADEDDTTGGLDYDDQDSAEDRRVSWAVSHTFPPQRDHAGEIAVDWPAVVVIELRARDSIGIAVLCGLLGEARAPSDGGPVVVVFGEGWAPFHHAADAAGLPYSLDNVLVANDLAQAVAIGVVEFDQAQRAPARPAVARMLLLTPP
jgi:hypothetical protein